jgi:predicted MPP superfamily phosphohydrolase
MKGLSVTDNVGRRPVVRSGNSLAFTGFVQKNTDMHPGPGPSDLAATVVRDARGPALTVIDSPSFEWTRATLPVPGLPEELHGFRFVHLTDLHVRRGWSRAYDRLIARLEAAAADLLLVTGDFVDDKHDHRAGLAILMRLLPRLRSRLGTYGILGNHDSDLLTPYINELGVTLLDGRRATLASADGTRVELIGLPGVARRDLNDDFVRTIPPKPPESLRIVLSHFPDHVRRVRPLRADVFLAGHTHGGQICLPGGRPIITHDTMDKSMCKGVHRVGDAWYVVGRGMGFAGIRVRANCPAEVIEVEVVGGEGKRD